MGGDAEKDRNLSLWETGQSFTGNGRRIGKTLLGLFFFPGNGIELYMYVNGHHFYGKGEYMDMELGGIFAGNGT